MGRLALWVRGDRSVAAVRARALGIPRARDLDVDLAVGASARRVASVRGVVVVDAGLVEDGVVRLWHPEPHRGMQAR